MAASIVILPLRVIQDFQTQLACLDFGGLLSFPTAYTATKAWVSCQQGYAAADDEAGASAAGEKKKTRRRRQEERGAAKAAGPRRHYSYEPSTKSTNWWYFFCGEKQDDK